MNDYAKQIGQKIKFIRKSKGINQKKLWKLMKEGKWSEYLPSASPLTRIESGKSFLSVPALSAITEALCVSSDDILSIDANASQSIKEIIDDEKKERKKNPRKHKYGPLLNYFIYCPSLNLIKIGQSHNVKHRMSSLQTATPLDTEFLGAFDGYWEFTEEKIHEKFKDIRVRGEWFKNTPELREFIEKYALPLDRAIEVAEMHGEALRAGIIKPHYGPAAMPDELISSNYITFESRHKTKAPTSAGTE